MSPGHEMKAAERFASAEKTIGDVKTNHKSAHSNFISSLHKMLLHLFKHHASICSRELAGVIHRVRLQPPSRAGVIPLYGA